MPVLHWCVGVFSAEKAEETIRTLATAFEAKDLVRAKELCVELRYWRNVDDAVKEKVNPVG